ncbi:OmpA family protein (plasmid) [Pseudomonas fulva]|uniref:Cell envelope biogenesis protein OmpA n=2 Tax=Pseudomonas putida group TaxID=136845 RepID=A0A1X0ZMQ2_PSEPU|nr:MULTISPECIES: OmpA family protein [Pseudomonas putida group]EKT4529975.1 OmpA family protein [Pseudomonas putida]ORL58655.1 cell envelope biogenesis protein OmpA [Pseudomonas putida]QOD01342.1 OmpA family protein [Pseudomonas putida]QPH46648.1 OmpA family protein [Pseudomonas fulva]QPH51813.1 OmpA family protein [Pseudomonas fulva]
MNNVIRTAAIALCLTFFTGCSVNPQTGEREFDRTAIGATVGGIAGGILGAAVGGERGALVGLAAGAALGGGTGYWMDKRAAKLQEELKRKGMEVSTGIDSATGLQMLTIQAPADVVFASASADLNPSAFQGLSAISSALKGQANLRVEVTGHTDATGSPLFNKLLSSARAQSVAQYLYAGGIPAQMIAVRGVGSLMPIASDATPHGRAQNRRVEIRIKQA